MKKTIKNIYLGITDGLFPAFGKSVDRKTKEINKVRLITAGLTWITALALVKGWIKPETAFELLKNLITL